MRAATYTRYGEPDVVSITNIATPVPKADEVLVSVRAAGVNTGDWRLRAAAFPGLAMAVAGRLMFGVTGPRKPILGSEFAGEVRAIGSDVTDFAVGDRVFGFSNGGAHAEALTIKANGAVLKTSEGLSDIEAAALPFGGLCALEFLNRFAGVKPGERLLVVGASGGVGAYAVQVAKALGAEVSGVASAGREDLVKGLGADQFVDYRSTPVQGLKGPYDVVFDTVGAVSYAQAAPMLADGGRFVPLNFGLSDFGAKRKARRNGHQVMLQVNGDSKDGLARLADMISHGSLRPVVDRVFPFTAIRDAYAHVEGRHRAGAVVLDLAH